MSLFRNLTIQARILLVCLLPLALVTAAIVAASANSLQDQGAKDIAELRDSLINARKESLRNLVDTAVSAIRPIYENAGPDDTQAKERVKSIVRSMDYGDNGYIYVYSYDGTARVLRPKPELEGQNLWDLKMDNDEYLIRELIADAKEGGAFYRYRWDNPATGNEEPKLSFTTGLDKWNWMIGTGVYLNDVEANVAAAREAVNTNVRREVLVTALSGIAAFALIAVIAVIMTRRIVGPIRETSRAMHEIAEGEGDLTQRLPVAREDEVGELARQFNAFVAKVQDTLRDVRGTTDQLASAAEELSQVAAQTRSNVDSQSQETDHIASAINEMTATVQEISRNAGTVQESARDADERAREGDGVVQENHTAMETLAEDISSTSTAVSQLAERSREIETVLDVIHDVTEQTNLLALNAAIEAARAGEQGRGFAVVAEEVRALAKRSSESADRIRTIIEGLVADTRTAVSTMERSQERSQSSLERSHQAREALQSIATAVSEIHEQITQIATAAEEQGQVAEELNRNVSGIVEAAGQSSEGVQQTSQASGELSRMGEQLRAAVSRFRV
ncbi:methyl-accepting chemotaxis protein [Arhodomonas aquaeolei]|uniref:methyl-accepting chemotaxis protein n=1 Tax=Arhodomonas aquaeolei TaxID=2369 RepID=UPI0021680B93|nr:methyl-accepting chemotaxis protein [Arhodomonas aquaeolei]MCS4505493.1 methyl-accepting chemotaxis protein [Arhodomonas aquaeolei]